MRITCPNCKSAYNVDERRLPAAGLNVRCPKCQNAFPVRPPAPAAPAKAVPLPAAAPAAPAPTAPLAAAPVPAAPPPAPAAPAAPAAPEGAGGGTIRFEAPFAAPPVARPPAAGPPAAAPPPVARPPPAAPPAPHEFTMRFDKPFGNEAPATTPPLSTVPLPAPSADSRPVIAPPPPEAFEADPLPVPGTTPPPVMGRAPATVPPPAPLGFGEVDLPGDAGEPLPVPPEVPLPAHPFAAPSPPPPAAADPFAVPSPPPAAAPSAGGPGPRAEELEALFEEASATIPRRPSPPRPPGAAEWSIRRRSGKVFGPFPEGEVVQMLTRGELLGNEEVTRDGESWIAMGEVAVFGEAIHRLLDRPLEVEEARPVGPSLSVAATEAARPRGPGLRERLGLRLSALPRWSRYALPVGVAVLVLGAGLAGSLTDHGLFFHRLWRGLEGPNRPGARLCAQARARLGEDTFAGAQAALDLARQAVALSAVDREAKGLFAQAAGWMGRRTGVAPGVLAQARGYAAEIRQKAPSGGDTAKAQLSLALVEGGPPAPGATVELERWLAGAPRDEDAVYLLGEAALAKGDPGRAAGLFQRLEQLHGSARSAHARGLAAVAQGDATSARIRFQEALVRDPRHLSSELELAFLAAASGATAEAEQRAARALGEAGAHGPRERARARQLRGELMARQPGDDAAARLREAEKELEQAVAEDGSWLPARVAWARFLLRRNAPDRALAAIQPAVAAGNPEAVDLQARALAATGRILDAVNALDAALARSSNPRLIYAKGWVLDLGGKRAEAEKLYAEAARDPAYWEPHLALGRLKLRAGDPEAAAPEILLAVERAPAEPDAQAGLAELRFAKGDLAGAAEAWRKALALDPAHAPSHLGLGRVALVRGDAAGAAEALERATRFDPRLSEGFLLLGTLRWQARDLSAAAAALETAANLDPKSALARTRLGAVQLEQGQVEAATGNLLTASNVDVALPENRFWLGRAYLAKGDAVQAAEQLAKAVELQGLNAQHHLWLGVAQEKGGKLGEAAESYRAALDRDPKLGEAAERLGLLHMLLSRYADAVPLLEKAVQLAPREPRLRMELADCRLKMGQASQAIQIYKDALKADSRLTVLYYRIARAVHESQGEAAAVPWYERAVKEDRENPMPHYYLGFHHKARGKRTRAVEEFRAYLRLKPDAEDRKDIEREIEDLGG